MQHTYTYYIYTVKPLPIASERTMGKVGVGGKGLMVMDKCKIMTVAGKP
jgi:hypothetical protein